MDALFLLGLEQVALDELVVGGRFYGRANYALPVLVPPQLLFYLHLDLLEDLQLAIMRWGLRPFLCPSEEVGGGLVGDGAGVADEDSAVGQQDGLIGHHIC